MTIFKIPLELYQQNFQFGEQKIMKINHFFIGVFLLLSSIGYTQQPIILNSMEDEVHLYDHISIYYHNDWKKIPIDTIINIHTKGEFYKPKNQRLYIQPQSRTMLLHFRIKNTTTTDIPTYLTLSNSYLNYGKVYYLSKQDTTALKEISFYQNFPFRSVNYRHPAWKINIPTAEMVEVFLEVVDNETRTRLDLKLETEQHFFRKIELEYLRTGLFIGFLLILIFALSIFGSIQKEYSIFFYCLYIILVCIEYLAAKGIGIQFLWWEQPFIIKNMRSMSQCLAFISAGCFYIYFYNYTKKTKWIQYFFIGSVLIVSLVLGLYLYKYLFGGLVRLYVYVWALLQVLVIIFVVLHAILGYRKVLPYYLGIAFSLPIIGILIQLFSNPSVYDPKLYIWVLSNLFYIGVTIEIIVVTYFILSSVIRSQLRYNTLKKEANVLKINFQEQILHTRIEAENNMVNDVHDSFGSNLAILKMSLLSLKEKEVTTAQLDHIETVLDNFNKEYRYILNSKFSPTINSESLISQIKNLVKKLDELSTTKITSDIQFSGKYLDELNCLSIYKIISELLTNGIKHAKAEHILLAVNQKSKTISIQAKDDGVGFNTKKQNSGSFGLKSLKERVKLLSGDMEIDSKINKGTTITIALPYEQ
ncbi:7TM diverse intracellular signaling domain-containing protein [Aquimarina longa]|uniref:7TM diverse intracellular signaling domain-containing protein n=1 Tax=Aquimarina longa TaxID=1080221 RepID=UPI0007825D6D|nr:7TM diverse intracellular signaling domain-containing protein [Aquimarina longa]